MHRKRPCRICRKWFKPHPRAGDRQQVCGDASCQRERHRRACKAWHQREQEAERAECLRRRLRPDPGETGVGSALLRWDVVRDAVGPQMAVILEELLAVLKDKARDAVPPYVLGKQRESGQVLAAARRDGMDRRTLAP